MQGLVAVYSINDLEKLSGIKAHTLRIWEQRYGIIEPKRTPTNIRYYQDDDLKFILNVALLKKRGVKISKIAKMSRREIAEMAASFSDVDISYSTQLDALTISMIEMNEYKFTRILDTNIRQMGFEEAMMEVIYPFLEKLNVLWLTGSINPAQENFIGALIRQKLIASINELPVATGSSKASFLLFLPEGERQELSLLFMHYLLRKRGFRSIYLGQDISLYDLKDACNSLHPHYIFTMISETFAREPVQRFVDSMSESFPESQIILSGYQVIAQQVPSERNIQVIKSLPETLDFLQLLNK
jgi:DNA-binding transcriptional MerR regulator